MIHIFRSDMFSRYYNYINHYLILIIIPPITSFHYIGRFGPIKLVEHHNFSLTCLFQDRRVGGHAYAGNGVLNLPVSAIFLLEIGTVLTVWWFWFSLYSIYDGWYFCLSIHTFIKSNLLYQNLQFIDLLSLIKHFSINIFFICTIINSKSVKQHVIFEDVVITNYK